MNNPQLLAILSASPLGSASVAALLPTIISIWSSIRSKITPLFFGLYLLFGFLSNRIEFIALPFIFLLGSSFWFAQNPKYGKSLRIIMGVSALVLSLAFFTHIIPGFHNIRILDNEILSKNGIPYSLYLNLDKPLVGIFILLFSNELIANKIPWRSAILETLRIAIPGFVIILILSYLIGYIQFDPKLNFDSLFFLWCFSNLFFTAFAEEIFCRAFVLKYMDKFCQPYKYGQIISLVFVSLFFGLIHYQGGISYIFLATIAGLFYGRVYQKTKRIEASILTHFTLNLVHFLLFTYPALASV